MSPAPSATSILDTMDRISAEKHFGQTRFDKVTPYITHPRAVAATFGKHQWVCKAIALGHDLFEDTDATPEYLRSEGIPQFIIHAIIVLTKIEGEDYQLYLERVKANEYARQVKIADMIANLSDSPTENQVKKYSKGLKFLLFP